MKKFVDGSVDIEGIVVNPRNAEFFDEMMEELTLFRSPDVGVYLIGVMSLEDASFWYNSTYANMEWEEVTFTEYYRRLIECCCVEFDRRVEKYNALEM